MATNLMVQSLAELGRRDIQVEIGLKAEPELWRRGEIPRQTQRRLTRCSWWLTRRKIGHMRLLAYCSGLGHTSEKHAALV
jgi:hypothetical protein